MGTLYRNGQKYGGGGASAPIATQDTAGIVKPDNKTIVVDEDGTISANYSNPNLLHNPFFTVNQRNGHFVPVGKPHYADADCTVLIGDITAPTAVVPYGSVYRYAFATSKIDFYVKASDVVDGYLITTDFIYTVDRWKSNANITINSDSSLTADPGTATTRRSFYQIINDKSLSGKTLTLSAIIKNNSGTRSALFYGVGSTIIITNQQYFSNSDYQLVTFTFTPTIADGDYLYVGAHCVSGSKFSFKAIKLELGEVSTLVNDIAPNYEEELIKCKTSKADSTDAYANQTVAMREDSIDADTVDGFSITAGTADAPATLATGTIYIQYEE